jgi:hypothetical protein
MRTLALLVALLLVSPVLVAADHVVDYDRTVDFSGIKSFAFRNARVGIDRPEIRNSLVTDRATGIIRSALLARGLREVEQGTGADILVDWTLTGQGMFVNQWGRAVPTGMGHNGGGQGAATESFIEAMLVVDMTDRNSGLLIWRGVLRDKQRDVARIAQRLPDYAGKLVAGYPGKKR